MNRARRLLLSGAALAGLLLPGTVVAQGTASAATTPVVYAAHADGWHAYRKPGSFYFGNGGAPYSRRRLPDEAGEQVGRLSSAAGQHVRVHGHGHHGVGVAEALGDNVHRYPA